jgi:hypothetical protein
MRIAFTGTRDLSVSQRIYCESVGAFYAEEGAKRGGCTLISGNAKGADQSFLLGGMSLHLECIHFELWLPWPDYEKKGIIGFEQIGLALQATPEQERYAYWAHPAWDFLAAPVRLLMIRNVLIVWTADLVIAHPDTKKKGWGGTGHTIRVAEMLRKPVFLCNRELQRFYQPGEY